MFIDKVVIPAMQFIFIYGIPIMIFGVGVFFLVKIFFMPTFNSGRTRQKKTSVARVLGKREEMLMNPSGIITLYYVTFDLNNDIIELMLPKNEYNRLNYGDKGDLSHTGDRFNKFVVIEKSNEITSGSSKISADTMRSSLNELAQKKRED